MKKYQLTISLITFFTIIASGQHFCALSKKISTTNYIGLPFRLETFANVISQDSLPLASARLFLRSDLQAGKNAIWTWQKEKATKAKWEKYQLEGTIDKDASSVVFGVQCEFAGQFYLYYLRLSVKTKEGRWKTIYENEFENGINGLDDGYLDETDFGKNRNFVKSIDKSQTPYGKACLGISSIDLPGSNRKAGSFAKINGINLYYEIYGTGKPLVILHGNGGSISGYAGSHLDYFSARYKVIAIDSRGHGKSIDSTTELTYELMASDINELLEKLKIDSAYIWGQSDGGIIALILALNHPDKVKKAVVFAANVIPDSTGIEALILRHFKRLASGSNDQKERQLNTLMVKHPNIALSKLNTISAQIMIMSGDRDQIPISHTLDIYKNIPNSNLCIIPGATHGAAWQKTKLFHEILTDFFEKPFGKPSSIDRYR